MLILYRHPVYSRMLEYEVFISNINHWTLYERKYQATKFIQKLQKL